MTSHRPSANEVQAQIFRRMTPAERLECCYQWTELAYELARAGVRIQHPEWTPAQVEREVGRRITGLDIDELRRKLTRESAAHSSESR